MPKRKSTTAIPAKNLGQEKLKGLLCTKYELPDHGLFWTPTALKTAPQVSDMVARYFGTPLTSFVAIRNLKSLASQKMAIEQQERANKKQTVAWLALNSFDMNHTDRLAIEMTGWKKIPYNPSHFEYPVGYRQTKDLKDVIISESNRAQLMDLFGSFGAGDEEKTSQKVNH